MKYGLLHSFVCGYPIVIITFVEKTVFLPLNGNSKLVDNQLP